MKDRRPLVAGLQQNPVDRKVEESFVFNKATHETPGQAPVPEAGCQRIDSNSLGRIFHSGSFR